MMLTTLADIARSAGLRVVEQSGWKTRGHGQMSGVRAVVCHHTAGPATGTAPSLGVVQNGRADLAGPLAHYVLGRDGTVYVVAAGLCWHAGAVLNSSWGNAYAIGIEAEATGVDDWPDDQIDAYARLCRALCAAFDLPVSAVLGHKEVCSPRGRKSDPNFDMSGFRARVTAANNNTTGGFLMQLTDTQQQQLYTWVKGLYTDASETWLANGKGSLTQGKAIAQIYADMKWMASIVANTPDLNGDGKQGDVSLVNFRQWLVDTLKGVDAKLAELKPVAQ
ncbi:hypothetical protein DMP23_00300 [Amycolatopsis sp. A1MSW2902]|uniref:N-acetylmuramoyl-L-alanine amidase n=1 Tax=Amycolatopsis sp. A1MSW2902 TaxID=687413 RepID=UPI00307CD6C7